MPGGAWPTAEPLTTARLLLEPLRVGHADEVAAALDDPALHEFIGGEPASTDELRARFGRQVRGSSADGSEGWLNWVLRDRTSGAVVGTVQATLTRTDDGVQADLAWVVARRWQGHGLASEAADALASWLRDGRADRLAAYVHPDHSASGGVARHLGLEPTDTFVDGERRWTGR